MIHVHKCTKYAPSVGINMCYMNLFMFTKIFKNECKMFIYDAIKILRYIH